MYSSSALVTASFLVLWPPVLRASSINRSSIARFVAMCRLSHIYVCKAIMRTKQNRGRLAVPGLVCWQLPGLIRFIFFDGIARMDVFHGKDDHSGSSSRRYADDDDLADGAPWQITHVDDWTVRLGEHLRIDRRCLHLSVLGDGGLERERIDRVVEVSLIGAHGAEIISHMHALIGAEVNVELVAGAHLR